MLRSRPGREIGIDDAQRPSGFGAAMAAEEYLGREIARGVETGVERGAGRARGVCRREIAPPIGLSMF